MSEYTGESVQENCIEWIKGSKTATVTFPKGKYVTKINKLAEQYPDEVRICDVNKDGSIVAHVPVSYISIRHPRTYSDDQKKKMGDRLRMVKVVGNTDEK